MCPAHIPFYFLTTCAMSFSPVLAIIHVDLCLLKDYALHCSPMAIRVILSRFFGLLCKLPGFAPVCHSGYYALILKINNEFGDKDKRGGR